MIFNIGYKQKKELNKSLTPYKITKINYSPSGSANGSSLFKSSEDVIEP